jgi:hypothetical protein
MVAVTERGTRTASNCVLINGRQHNNHVASAKIIPRCHQATPTMAVKPQLSQKINPKPIPTTK